MQSQLAHEIEPSTALFALDEKINIDRVSNVAEQYHRIPANQQKRKVSRLGSFDDSAKRFLHFFVKG